MFAMEYLDNHKKLACFYKYTATESLSQFLTEARTSKAADQAKKLRLKGDGHGGWYLGTCCKDF